MISLVYDTDQFLQFYSRKGDAHIYLLETITNGGDFNPTNYCYHYSFTFTQTSLITKIYIQTYEHT